MIFPVPLPSAPGAAGTPLITAGTTSGLTWMYQRCRIVTGLCCQAVPWQSVALGFFSPLFSAQSKPVKYSSVSQQRGQVTGQSREGLEEMTAPSG